jgi:hypothetical protein
VTPVVVIVAKDYKWWPLAMRDVNLDDAKLTGNQENNRRAKYTVLGWYAWVSSGLLVPWGKRMGTWTFRCPLSHLLGQTSVFGGARGDRQGVGGSGHGRDGGKKPLQPRALTARRSRPKGWVGWDKKNSIEGFVEGFQSLLVTPTGKRVEVGESKGEENPLSRPGSRAGLLEGI